MRQVIRLKTKYLKTQISSRLFISGLNYYKRGYVKQLIEDPDSGDMDLMVQGTRHLICYRVQLLKNENGYDLMCDCPTEVQPCKHTIAGIIALHDLKEHGKWQKHPFHPWFRLINLFRRFKLQL